MSKQVRRWIGSVAVLLGIAGSLAGCGGGSADAVPGSTDGVTAASVDAGAAAADLATQTTPAGTTPADPPLATRQLAASRTAQSAGNACSTIRPFYWELGDRARPLAGGSVKAAGSSAGYDAQTVMNIASASKWLYGAYVVERRQGALTAEDLQFLNFRSGYTSFGFSGCEPQDTVASCVARGDNGVQTPGIVDKFFYNGGHMQKHASLPWPGMALGALDNAALALEMRRVLGRDIALSYTQPQLPGGVRTSAADYALFLRKLLGGQLRMGALLGSHPVCTNPATCSEAVYSPVDPSLSWHYSIGHWVEDDPVAGDGAFSSAGAFGFYPWVDASKAYYGIVARVSMAGEGAESAACGAQIRQAWMSGVAR